MTSKRSPQHAVTNAAYLLFYRRRSDRPLGGPYFEKIIEECQQQDESSPSSPASSVAGDGERFGDSSRVGSSNEYQEAEVARLEPTTLASERTAIEHAGDEAPPNYSSLYPENSNNDEKQSGADQMDVDEGVDTTYSVEGTGPFSENPGWGFDNATVMNPSMPVPPGSSDEDLMDGASDKAVADGSSPNLSDRGDRMADFGEDDDDVDVQGLIGDPLESSPPRRLQIFGGSSPPVEEIPIEPSTSPPPGVHYQFGVTNAVEGDIDTGDDDDAPVAEVHIDPSGEQEQDARDR